MTQQIPFKSLRALPGLIRQLNLSNMAHLWGPTICNLIYRILTSKNNQSRWFHFACQHLLWIMSVTMELYQSKTYRCTTYVACGRALCFYLVLSPNYFYFYFYSFFNNECLSQLTNILTNSTGPWNLQSDTSLNSLEGTWTGNHSGANSKSDRWTTTQGLSLSFSPCKIIFF